MDGLGLSSVHKGISVSGLWEFNCLFTNILTKIDILDGGMVVVAMYSLNIFHPGLLVVGASEHSRHDNLCDITLKKTETVEPCNTSTASSLV